MTAGGDVRDVGGAERADGGAGRPMTWGPVPVRIWERSSPDTCGPAQSARRRLIVAPRPGGRFHETRGFLHDPLAAGGHRRVLCCNGDMSLDELCDLLERHVRPDLAT